MPFGVSTFSSFGADKTRVGYSAGLYGGYRFNPVLSLEGTAEWGQINLSSQGCCIGHNLWLGSDGVRYNAPVLDMDGWGYDNLRSSVFMQHYGLQLNVNILGFFNSTKNGRWTLEVSPLLAAVGTCATVSAVSDGAEALAGDTRWHLGAGGNLQAGFQVTKHLNIGVYSGIAYLTGDRMDGVPMNRHKANYVWESGIKIGWTFGKRKAKSGKKVVAPVVEEIPDQVRNDVERDVRNDEEGMLIAEPAVEPVMEPVMEPVVELVVEPVAELVVEPVVGPEPEDEAAIPASPGHHGTVSPHHHGTVPPRHHGTVPLRHPGSVPPHHHGTVSPRHHGTVPPRHHGTVPPRHPVLDTGSPEDSSLPIIYFEFRTKRISWSELPKVNKIKAWMDANPDKKIEIIGWADHRGDAEYNMILSHERAETIRQCLVNLGVPSDHMTTKGMGVDNDAENVNAARRVECVIVE